MDERTLRLTCMQMAMGSGCTTVEEVRDLAEGIYDFVIGKRTTPAKPKKKKQDAP